MHGLVAGYGVLFGFVVDGCAADGDDVGDMDGVDYCVVCSWMSVEFSEKLSDEDQTYHVPRDHRRTQSLQQPRIRQQQRRNA